MPNIDELTTEFHRKMTNDGSLSTFSLTLALQKTNAERARCCYQRLQKYQLFPKQYPTVKKDESSARYREIGNNFFKKKVDKRALHNYNLAIMHASSPNLIALGYANRSAVLHSMKRYEDCLVDIERAINSPDYDNSLKPKLIRRRESCLEEIKKMDKEDPRIDQTRKKVYAPPEHRLRYAPCASELLKISTIPTMGRCVLAAEDISPGDVLVEEKPYLNILLKTYYVDRCYNCCGDNRAKIPCSGCPFVMFCNEKCREESWNLFHKFECPAMTLLSSFNFSKIEILALRTVIRARTDHSSWEELFEVIAKAEGVTDLLTRGFVNVKDPDNPDVRRPVYDSKYYTSIHMLETNESRRDVSDIFNRATTAAVLMHILKNYTTFFDDCSMPGEDVMALPTDHYVWKAAGLLIHHNMTSASNMHSLEATTETSDHKFTNSVHYASAAFAFLSLFNHSCSPNAQRYTKDGLNYLLALRPIKKEQQIFDNYGSHFAVHSYEERQRCLQFQYKFKCVCEACEKKWPMYMDLPKAVFRNKRSQKEFKTVLEKGVIEKLEAGDKSVICDLIDKLYEHAILLEETAPSKELADYQETIKQCWALLTEVIY